MTTTPRLLLHCLRSPPQVRIQPWLSLIAVALLVVGASVQAAIVRAATLPEVRLSGQQPGPITAPPAQPPQIRPQGQTGITGPSTRTQAGPDGPAIGVGSGPSAPALPSRRAAAPKRLSAALQTERQRLQRVARPKTGYGTTQTAANAAWTLGLIELHLNPSSAGAAQAQTWFERAAQYGRQPLAQAGLAWCAIDGCKGPPDPSTARQAVDRLRPHHRARALYLQWLLDRRLQPLAVRFNGPEGVSQLRLPLRDMLERAAAEGDTQARIELGIEAVVNGELKVARKYFQAAARNSLAATANLELLDQEEVRMAQRAAAGTPTEAEQLFENARRAHRGVGAPPNYGQALRLYQAAAAQGSEAARRMLALITSRLLPDGSVNPAWMAQLAWMDTANTLPRLDTRALSNLMHREPTPLFDLLPQTWRRALSPL